VKLETFAKQYKLRIIADFDPQRMHRWHVTIESVYGCRLTFLGTKFRTFRSLPVGVGQSFTAACNNLVGQLQDGAIRTGGPMRPSFTLSVPNLKTA
jgi:hypothetical protein